MILGVDEMRYFKKLWLIFPILFWVFCLTSCKDTTNTPGGTTDTCNHTYATEWEYNAREHFHRATCEHKTLTKDNEPHIFEEWEPSDNEKLEQRGCKVCEYVETRPIEVAEHTHTYGAWRVAEEPTVEAAGRLERVCSSNQDHIDSFDLPKLNGINYAYKEETPSTCSSKGKASYTYDKDGQKFKFTVELDYTSHTYGKWEMVQEPTKEDQGKIERVCSTNQNHKDSFELPQLNQTDYTYHLTPASCLVAGKEVYTYSKDQQEFRIELPISATGHTYELKHDASKHWSGATCEHSSLKKEIADHTFENNICTVCHYEKTVDESVIYQMNSTEDGVIASFNPEYTGSSILVSGTYMDLPVVELQASSFDGKNIESITLPSSIKKINRDVFKTFTKVKDVYYDGSIEDWCLIEFVDKTSTPMVQSPSFYQRGETYWEETTKLILPSTIQKIGNYQFAGFSHIDEIVLPDELKIIGEEGFANCTGITELIVPEGVNQLGKKFLLNIPLKKLTLPFLDAANSYIGYYFGNTTHTYDPGDWLHNKILSSLEELHITKATQLGDYAFSNLPNLKKLTLPNTLVQLGKEIIYGCPQVEMSEFENGYYLGNSDNPHLLLVKMKDTTVTSFTISTKTQMIYDGTFKNAMMTALELPASLTDIGIGTFENSAIKSITIPGRISQIKKNTFKNCASLEEVVLPADLTNIADGAFLGTSIKKASLALGVIDILTKESLEELTLLEGEGSINLGNYPNLTTVILTDDISNIGSDLLTKCPKLEYTIEGGIAYLGSQNNPYLWLIQAVDKTIERPAISTDTDYIYDQAFKDCTEITSVTLPGGVISIGNEAFMNDTKLTSVSYLYSISHSKLTTLGNKVFSNCSSLKSFDLPDSLEKIGNYLFSGCISLAKLSIPFVGTSKAATSPSSKTVFGALFGESRGTGLVSVEQYFRNGTTSTSRCTYYIPAALKEVEVRGGNLFYGAFYNCSMIEKITISENVVSNANPEDYLFRACEFKEMSIPCSFIKYIDEDSRSGLKGYIEKLTITSGEEIPFGAFESFSALKQVILADTIKTISIDAFRWCSQLTSIQLPSQLETIEQCAFAECTSLQSISLPNTLKTIGNQAFYKCTSLPYVVLPKSLTTIHDQAFEQSLSTKLLYEGTEAEWNQISTKSGVYFYSETAQTGNYWHYVENVPTIY